MRPTDRFGFELFESMWLVFIYVCVCVCEWVNVWKSMCVLGRWKRCAMPLKMVTLKTRSREGFSMKRKQTSVQSARFIHPFLCCLRPFPANQHFFTLIVSTSPSKTSSQAGEFRWRACATNQHAMGLITALAPHSPAPAKLHCYNTQSDLRALHLMCGTKIMIIFVIGSLSVLFFAFVACSHV